MLFIDGSHEKTRSRAKPSPRVYPRDPSGSTATKSITEPSSAVDAIYEYSCQAIALDRFRLPLAIHLDVESQTNRLV